MKFRLPSGRQLHYHDSGQGPVLVLLHGWAMSSGIFADTVRALAKGFRLLVPDLPGHGCSEPGEDYTLDGISTDIQVWLESQQLESFSLLGWSFGGQVALQLAATGTLPIRRLVLVASTPKFCQSAEWAHGLPEIQLRAMERRFQRNQWSTLDFFSLMMFEREKNVAALCATVRERSILPDPSAGMQTLSILRTGDLRAQLTKIDIPTLIHHGKNDTIIPASAGLFLSEQMRNTEVVLWEDVGHAPFLSFPGQSHTLWKDYLL